MISNFNNVLKRIRNDRNFSFTISLALGDVIERLLNIFVNIVLVLSFVNETQDQFLNSIVLTGFISIVIGFLASYPIISDKKFSKVTSALMSVISQYLYILILIIIMLNNKLNLAEFAGLFIVAGPSLSRTLQILLRILSDKKYLNIYIFVRFIYILVIFPCLFFLLNSVDMKLKLTFVIGLLDSFSAVFLSSIYLKKLIDNEKLGIYLKIFWKDLANINTLNNFLTQQLNSLLAYVFILATIYLPFLKPLKLDIFYAYKLCNYMQLPANYIQIGRFRDDLVPPFLIKTFSKLILVCSIFTSLILIFSKLLPEFNINIFQSSFEIVPTIFIFITLSSVPRAQSAFLFDLNLRKGNFNLIYKSYMLAIITAMGFLLLPWCFINFESLNEISIFCISSGSIISYLVLTCFLSKYRVKQSIN